MDSISAARAVVHVPRSSVRVSPRIVSKLPQKHKGPTWRCGPWPILTHNCTGGCEGFESAQTIKMFAEWQIRVQWSPTLSHPSNRSNGNGLGVGRAQSSLPRCPIRSDANKRANSHYNKRSGATVQFRKLIISSRPSLSLSLSLSHSHSLPCSPPWRREDTRNSFRFLQMAEKEIKRQ